MLLPLGIISEEAPTLLVPDAVKLLLVVSAYSPALLYLVFGWTRNCYEEFVECYPLSLASPRRNYPRLLPAGAIAPRFYSIMLIGSREVNATDCPPPFDSVMPGEAFIPLLLGLRSGYELY